MIKKMVKFSVVLLLRVKLISAEMEVEGRESLSRIILLSNYEDPQEWNTSNTFRIVDSLPVQPTIDIAGDKMMTFIMLMLI